MGLLAQRALSGDNDGYYATTPPVWSVAGVNVSGDAALRISTVFACRRILAETVGSLPCVMYRRTANDGKDRAAEHPLYDLLHDEPNDEQSAQEWFELMTGWAAIRGTARSEIIGGQRGMVDQLVPYQPQLWKRETVRTSTGSAIRYDLRNRDGIGSRKLLPDQVFTLRGMSDDGIQGLAIGDLAADTFGVALAAERHAARSFGTAPHPAMTFELPVGQRLGDEAYERLQKDLAKHAGAGGNRALILEDGAKANAYGMTNEDAEFLATRQFTVNEICRWFRIPPHMVADLERSTNNNIEHQGIEFVIYTMLPWFRRWEQAIGRQLIVARRTFFAEFLVAGLLRGDLKSRYEAYAIARSWGWMSVNDIRRLENENAILGGDDYRQPMNSNTGVASPRTPSGQRMLGLLANDAAARVVRKEITAMRRLADRDEASWADGVNAFYATHASHVAREVHIDMTEAEAWVERQRAELVTDGPAALERWEADRSDSLAAVALAA
jgi:HK97 family phage portal protein